MPEAFIPGGRYTAGGSWGRGNPVVGVGHEVPGGALALGGGAWRAEGG